MNGMECLPERAQAERALLSADAVVCLVEVVSVDEALVMNKLQFPQRHASRASRLTFEVSPPRSRECKIALSVLKNRGSD